MGDRTYCSLYLSGVLLNADDLKLLYKALHDAGAEECTRVPAIPESGILDGHFNFYEVNYGEMDSNLEEVLDALFLSYVWSWDRGDNYGPGTKLYDAKTGYVTDNATFDGEYVISIDKVEDTELVAQLKEARATERVLTKTPLIVAGSSHRLLEILSNDQDVYARWMEARENLESLVDA